MTPLLLWWHILTGDHDAVDRACRNGQRERAVAIDKMASDEAEALDRVTKELAVHMGRGPEDG